MKSNSLWLFFPQSHKKRTYFFWESHRPILLVLFYWIILTYSSSFLVHRYSSLCIVRNGHIKRITDPDIQSSVLEICGSNVSTTFVTCPADPKETLGVKLPFLVLILKNLNKYFTFEVTVLDDKNVRRRFRASNYQVSKTVSCEGMGVVFSRTEIFPSSPISNFYHSFFTEVKANKRNLSISIDILRH